VAEFTVSAGETIPFVLSYSPSHIRVPPPVAPDRALEATEHVWRDWCKKAPPVKQYGEAVTRSRITL
jgi:hypothetical protein